jgi:serine/threonine protein phosphatase 1
MVLQWKKQTEQKRGAPAAASQRSPQGPAGKRCYVIGDVHGRRDLLEGLLDQIRIDAARHDRTIIIVCVGDLIDRGLDSKGVIELARARPVDHAQWVFLKGNHEEALVDGLNGRPALLLQWLQFGGFETARSYGVEIGALFGRDAETVETVLQQAIPKPDLDFMAGFIDSARFGDYGIVHAGVRPGIAFGEQATRDLRWIREEFIESDADHGLMILHGHTIFDEVDVRPNRIGLDTGAYRTGKLSALWIDGAERGVLTQVGAPGEDKGWW